ncbi:MAG: acyl-CoA thioesterase [Candidatus Eremiobacteraeota bacterium]|nr:acyl-CoA thioesterase [Candidatus Eremiobacteraeota bacterium]
MQWQDIDIAGIIYFGAYVRYCERAEMDIFRELGFPYKTVFEQHDIWLPRVRLEFDFHKPAYMDDELILRTHIERVGASSVRWKTVLFNEGQQEVDAVCSLVIACIDRSTLKSRPLPPALRSTFLACIGTGS